MKKVAKRVALFALMALVAVCLAVGLTACGGSGGSVNDIKIVGYYNDIYDEAGMFGSTTNATANSLTLYNDGTYVLDSADFAYMAAASGLTSDVEVRVFGTYTVINEDEYSVDVSLSAATDVIYRLHGFGGMYEFYRNTMDASTMTGELMSEMVVADAYGMTITGADSFGASATDTDNADFYRSLYGATTGWSIDIESHALTMGK